MARAGVFLQNLHALMVKQRGAWLLLLVLLWQQQQEACCVKLETAYLVQSLRQPYDSLNSSYDSLSGILSSPHGSYGTIILTEDYEVAPREFASDPVRLAHDLLITSPLGQRYQLSFAFLVGGLSCSSGTAHCALPQQHPRARVIQRGQRVLEDSHACPHAMCCYGGWCLPHQCAQLLCGVMLHTQSRG